MIMNMRASSNEKEGGNMIMQAHGKCEKNYKLR